MSLYKQEKIKALKKRNIILFGAGEYARQFYRDFKEELNMVGCITNNENETVFQIDGEDIFQIHRVSEIASFRDSFIIVCARENQMMQEQLRTLGLTYGSDFLDCDLIRVLFSEKKVALFYGVEAVNFFVSLN